MSAYKDDDIWDVMIDQMQLPTRPTPKFPTADLQVPWNPAWLLRGEGGEDTSNSRVSCMTRRIRRIEDDLPFIDPYYTNF